tara:strand:+ start:794 stop:1024 length:231 start_codon:yes stop_codon:yes gene_type:complete
MDNKIKLIMSSVFKVSIESIDDDSSPDSLDYWDSLGHMVLISAIEDEFDIELDESEIIEMMNFKLIKLIIKEKFND